MQKADLTHRFFILSLVVILFLAAVIATRTGTADFYAYSPRQHLQQWQKSAKIPSEEKLSAELTKIRTAIEWQENKAEYRDIEALLLYYQALHHYQANDPGGFHTSTLEAIESYRKATLERPNWPYSWANLALMKAAIKQFDPEYEQALIKAVTLGPWENSVNVSVAEAGLLGWSTLAPSTQSAVVDNIERGLKRNTPTLKKRLKAINKLGMACIYLKSSKERKQLCGF